MAGNKTRRAKGAKKGNKPAQTKQPQRAKLTNMKQYLGMPMNMSESATQYYSTVVAPCSGNARIPDFSCLPSFLMTLDDEITVSANAALVCGAVLSLKSLNATGANGPIYATEGSSSTDAAIILNTAVPFSAAPSATAVSGRSRLVSACLDVTYIGSSLNDSGMLAGSSLWNSDATLNTLVSITSQRTSGTSRVNNGMSVTYRPGDSTSFDYIPVFGTAFQYGTLVFHATGLTAGASFRVRVRMNYECLPSNDTSDLSTSQVRSPVDPIGLAHAVSNLQAVKPIQTVVTQELVTNVAKSAFDIGRKNAPAIISGVQKLLKAGSMFL